MGAWSVVDEIVGEELSVNSYVEALVMADQRVAAHGQEFEYGRVGNVHRPVKCKVIEDKESKKVTIVAK